MKTLFAIVLALPLAAQQVSISQQPGQVFVATFGAPLAKVAVYSAIVCSTGATATGSWGQVRQIAEVGGLNVVDAVLVPATAQRAQNRTTMHKIIVGAGYAGLATALVAIFHGAPPWLIEAGAGISGVASVLNQPLTASETQVQNTITSALGALADPTAQFTVAAGSCTGSKLFLGNYVANFKPISVPLVATPTSVKPAGFTLSQRSEATVAVVWTHPALPDAPTVTVASWDTAVLPRSGAVVASSTAPEVESDTDGVAWLTEIALNLRGTI